MLFLPEIKPNSLDPIPEMSEEEASFALETAREDFAARDQRDPDFRETGIAHVQAEVAQKMLRELRIEAISGHDILKLSTARMRAIHSLDPAERQGEINRALNELVGINPIDGDPVVYCIVADDAAASSRIER